MGLEIYGIMWYHSTMTQVARTLKKRFQEIDNDIKTELGLLCAQCGDEIGYGIKGHKVTCSTCARDNNLEWEPRRENADTDQDFLA